MLTCIEHNDLDDFKRRHTQRWLANEAQDSALLRLRQRPDGNPQVGLTIIDAQTDTVLHTACMSVGRQLTLSSGAPHVLAFLASHIVQRHWHLPGLFAPRPASEDFVDAYARLTGLRLTRVKALAHMELTALTPPGRVCGGGMRLARASEIGLLASFRDRAQQEGNTQLPFDSEASVRADLSAGASFVWEDGGGQVVCAASLDMERSARSAYINHVYTPAALRRQGYATALVRGLAARALEQGKVVSLSVDADSHGAISVYLATGFKVCCTMDNMRLL